MCRHMVKSFMDTKTNITEPSEPEGQTDLSLERIVALYGQVASEYVIYVKDYARDTRSSFSSRRLLKMAIKELDKRQSQGEPLYEAWNHSAIVLIEAAQAYTRYWVADCFVRCATEASVSIQKILTQLCHLFLIYWLRERSGDFISVTAI